MMFDRRVPGLATRLLIAIAMMAVLSACGGSAESPKLAGNVAPKSAKKEAIELSEQVAAAPREVSSAVADDPNRLLGLDRANLTAILGAPRFVRRDSAAQLWRYRNKSCVLHIYFYRNNDSDAEEMTVHHFEAHNLRGGPEGASACLNKLLASHDE